MIDSNALSTRLSAGMLHFDASLGCTAELLIGALTDLKGDVSDIKKGFEACGIRGLEPFLRQEAHKSIAGISVDFLLPLGASLRTLKGPTPANLPLPRSSLKRSPAWARTKETHAPVPSEVQFGNDIFSAWLRGE